MTAVHRFRVVMAKHLGQTITPEIAAAIEQEALYPPPTPIDPARFEPAQCGSIVFAVERFIDVLDDLRPLHEQHYLETEKHRHGLQLRPDYQAMLLEDRAGTLLQVTARKDGKLVGHLRLYIRRSRHTDTLFASEDALFLAPQVRGGRTALRMELFAERVLWQLGVREVRATAKLVNGAARFLEGACGFRPVATELVKFLAEPPTQPGAGRAGCSDDVRAINC